MRSPLRKLSPTPFRKALGLVAALAALFALSAALFGGVVGGCGGSDLERVQLDSGPITGAIEKVGDQEVWVFKGIPYAAPPVGDLRWRVPQPVEPWTEPRDCTEFAAACPQPLSAETFYLAVGSTNEDCLYLNVWSPAESADEKLPVMVWIHGGSFETGAGSMEVYDGRNLATKGVAVVTINYRLGPLGFLAHPALSAESPEGTSGNYGLLDQIAALHWVQANIAGFGGDPANVTVFGESAGAISILDLMVSPFAEGLFQRAIAESGILLDYGFGVSTAAAFEGAEAAGEDLAARLGVDSTGDVAAQLRDKTPAELLEAASAMAAASLLDQGLTWKPVADGYVLPDLPTTLWAEGKAQPVPLLIGSNTDEGNLFLSGLTVSPSDVETYIRRIFAAHADEALALYPVVGAEEPTAVLSRMLTEVGFASTARFAARSNEAPTYMYQFTRVPFGNALGAFHGVEIPYVFGTASLFSVMGPIQQADYDLSAAIMGYWTRFAATGDPNGAGTPEWPRYDARSDRHLELGDQIRPGAGLYKRACDLADTVRGLE